MYNIDPHSAFSQGVFEEGPNLPWSDSSLQGEYIDVTIGMTLGISTMAGEIYTEFAVMLLYITLQHVQLNASLLQTDVSIVVYNLM